MHNRLREVTLILGLAAVYLLAARFGFAFEPVSGFATLVWPPAGIAVAAVLVLGNRVAPGILLGALVANLLAGAPVLVSIAIGLGNMGEALVGAAILRRVPGFSPTLERVTSVVGLIVGAAMASPIISATVGVTSLYAGGTVQSSRFGETWRAWWIGDMVGILLVASLILVWSSAPRVKRELRPIETIALVAALVVVSALTFLSSLPYVPTIATPFHLADLLVAILVWAAIRFGQRGATAAVLFVSTVAIVATARGYGPFVLPKLSERLLLLQTFMAIVATTCLLFGATIAERHIANQEAREAGLEAEAANSAKTQFLRVMSHELRTPLNAIAGFAEMLETGVHGALNEKQADAVKRIQKNEQDLLAIINEMLGFVNAEKTQLAAESVDVQVAAAFDVAELQVAADVERKHLVVERALGRPDLVVWADPKGLELILASLLSNACKYTKDGGTITLGADAKGDAVRLWIRDTGIGIRKEEIDRVFEPFFQSDAGTTRRYSGIGLGLTIARDLARRMEGEVTIESEAGKGTTASIVLPMRAARDRENAAQKPARNVAA
jgi:signal transduction histidine kinase